MRGSIAEAPRPPLVALTGPPGSFRVELLIFNGWPSSDYWAYWVCSQNSPEIGVMIHDAGDLSHGSKPAIKRCHDLGTDPNTIARRIPLQWVDGKYFDEQAMLNNKIPQTVYTPVCPFEGSICKTQVPERKSNAADDVAAPGRGEFVRKNLRRKNYRQLRVDEPIADDLYELSNTEEEERQGTRQSPDYLHQSRSTDSFQQKSRPWIVGSAYQLLKDDIFNEKVVTYIAEISMHDPISKQLEGKSSFDWPGSWVWEIAAAVLSAICIALLVVFLVYVDGRIYGTWQYGVSPNAVVATITTVAKGAALVAVSSCLSQLKWNRYQVATPLFDLQVMDQASRGPWGAFTALWNVTPGLATVGALLMVLSVTLSPFTQQILTFPSQHLEALNETASVQVTREYFPDESHSYYVSHGYHDPLIEETVLNGISAEFSPVEPQCSTGSCRYPDFITLGVCSRCEDVTSTTVQNCSALSKTWKGWTEDGYLGDEKIPEGIPLNCTYTTPNGVSIAPGISYWHFLGNYETRELIEFNRATWTSVATESFEDSAGPEGSEGLTRFLNITNPILQFSSAKLKVGSVIYAADNITATLKKPIITECALYYCEQEYKHPNVSVNHRILQPTRTQPLRYADPPSTWGEWDFNKISPLGPLDDTDAISGNSSYAVARSAEWDLRGALVRWLNTTNVGPLQYLGADIRDIPGFPASSILFKRDDLTETFINIATSITDTMRAGTRASTIKGQPMRDVTYIHVRWWWVTPLLVNTGVSIGLLIATAIRCRKSRALLWKSSVLPLLLSRVDTLPYHDLVFRGRVDELEEASKTVNVTMKEDNGHFLFKEH